MSDCSIGQEPGLGPVSSRRRQRSRRRRPSVCPSRFILLALSFVAANSWARTHAFSSPTFCSRPRTRTNHCRRRQICMSSLAEPPPSPSSASTFQRRMRGLMTKRGAGGRTAGQRVNLPANVKTVESLMDFKMALDDAGDKIVVVRFFAAWCKACKAIQPAYYRMANMYPDMVFLDVPVTNENANLHQGLAVPSLPYSHIYHPEAGLVEEMKMSKKYFRDLARTVRWYDAGECNLDEFVPGNWEDDA